jgi:hypothetical protein
MKERDDMYCIRTKIPPSVKATSCPPVLIRGFAIKEGAKKDEP